MKINKVLIALIVLNIGLAGAVAYLLKRESTSPALVTTPVEISAPAQVVERTKLVATVTTNTVQVDWNMVESDDYKKYIANLRSIGCPPETVRDIILADVNKLFAARFVPLAEPPRTNEFWKRAPVRGADEERVKQRLAIVKEKKALLKELLGEDIDVKDEAMPSDSDPRAEMLSFLPQEKIQQISEMDATYAGKQNSPIHGRGEGVQSLEAEKRAELAKVLSPQELEDYNLRASRTANVLRATMGSP
jgi:uncharacterized membrane protein